MHTFWSGGEMVSINFGGGSVHKPQLGGWGSVHKPQLGGGGSVHKLWRGE